jgi:hypothetical protein
MDSVIDPVLTPLITFWDLIFEPLQKLLARVEGKIV